MVKPEVVAEFLHEQDRKQLPTCPAQAALTFLATTSVAGRFAAPALAEVLELAPGAASNAIDVRLKGGLPRRLLPGDSATVSICRYDQFQGYQVKTATLRSLGEEGELLDPRVASEVALRGHQAYTVHHGPYTVNFFEHVPLDEVRKTVAGCRHAVVAIGPQVNVTPRFVWRTEVKGGQLVTFHADGAMMKTYRNLAANRSAVRLVFDLASLRGYAIYGHCEEVRPEQAPEAWRASVDGFERIQYGKPSRVFRLISSRIEPLQVAS
jgi:hypothetical protein